MGGGGARIDIPVSRRVGGDGTLRKDISSPASESAFGDIGARGGGGGTARAEEELGMLDSGFLNRYSPSAGRPPGTGGAPAVACRAGGEGRSMMDFLSYN